MDLDPPIASAVDYLLAAADRDGWWRDFETLAGWSDEWTTAFVGAALAAAGTPSSLDGARRCWSKLRRRRPWSSGWGFNRLVPADADSTAWTLRLAEAIGAEGSWRARRGYAFVERNMRPSGAIATYGEDGPIRHFTRLARGVSFAGWCAPHTCVTAAVGGLRSFPRRPDVLGFLRSNQEADGRWRAYWWCDDELSTALAAEALSRAGGTGDEAAGDRRAEDRAVVERAVSWALSRASARMRERPKDGSVFAAAWLLNLLAIGAEAGVTSEGEGAIRAEADGVADWLVERQLPTGAWPSSARLRIPPPNAVDPASYAGWTYGGKGGGSIVPDGRALYTTASVLTALSAARRLRGTGH